jgi:hypothetical protein
LRRWAAIRNPQYGDKLTTELTGKDGGPIQTEEMSPNDLARRIAFTLANGLKKPD